MGWANEGLIRLVNGRYVQFQQNRRKVTGPLEDHGKREVIDLCDLGDGQKPPTGP